MAAMATDLDTELGRVVEALQKESMWDNTLLVLVADNGGPPYVANSNWPMRGGDLLVIASLRLTAIRQVDDVGGDSVSPPCHF